MTPTFSNSAVKLPHRRQTLALEYSQVAGELLSLSQALQEHLDVDKVLETFSHWIDDDVPHYGLRFVPAGQGAQSVVGEGRGERREFELAIHGECLGKLVIGLRRPVEACQLAKLEHFLAQLTLPLRNALRYREAITQATRDSLTGVFNRSTLESSVQRELSLSERQSVPLSLLVLDVDRFKGINDDFGHHIGDEVIRAVADNVSQALRETDLVFRFGGDEFVVVMPGSDGEGAVRVADRVRRRVAERPLVMGNTRILISLSLGVTESRPGDCVDTLFQRADRALLDAKRGGRNRVELAR